ncbi:MAG: tetratricopeptide repeat protein, partial [candidate division WOR-3 bacterium]|nr:tetratricopeptide repeat protein [candidate division WOR-3 bacterium]
ALLLAMTLTRKVIAMNTRLVFTLWILSIVFSYASSESQTRYYARDSIEKYRALVQHSPNSEPLWFNLQTAFIQAGDFQSALKLAKISLSDRLLWGRIRAFLYCHQFDSCLHYIFELSTRFAKSQYTNDALQLAILLFQAQSDTLTLKKYADACYFFETNQYADAQSLTQAIIANKKIVAEFGYLLLSSIFLAKNESNQAVATLQEFLEKFPQSLLVPKAQYQLGVIYLEVIKNSTMAQNIFENLIANFPESPESYFARAKLNFIRSNSKTK